MLAEAKFWVLGGSYIIFFNVGLKFSLKGYIYLLITKVSEFRYPRVLT